MPIVPDTKDWTWVLERTCEECGFDVRDFPREDVGDMIRRNAREWEQELASPRVKERPTAETWSALEYGCHVRDVLRLYDHRLQLMLEQDNPRYPNWDQDETALAERYEEQDPAVVSTELSEAAALLAERFDRLATADWDRMGRRSDGVTFTVGSFARYLIHDPVHHLWDVRKGFKTLDGEAR